MAFRCLVASLVLTCALVAPTAASGRNPVLLGVYPSGPDLASHLESLADIDAWIAPTGRRIALAGDFLDIEYTPAVAVNLSATWDSGRIPFVKLLTVRTAADIANGLVDPAISAWGRAFARWSAGGQRRAFVAPLAEMNGNWISYYSDAATSVRAYRRIRTLVNAELQAARVPPNAIGWVFAPNGWSQPGDEFERFYPGHDEADAVGFSAYNWGRCPPWHKWDTFETGFLPYLVRIRAMAPGKPIFIAETAVIDRLSRPMGDRDQWFRDTYAKLAAFPALRGIMYFNKVLPTQPNLPACPNPDFRLRIPGSEQWRGFKDAVANPASSFGYWAPASAQVANVVFARTVPRMFDDVHPIHPFAREPGDVDYSPWIHTVAAVGLMPGCGTQPPRFCPGGLVSRAEAAMVLLRAAHGAGYVPPPATGRMFDDVDRAHPQVRWIERLVVERGVAGCQRRKYCPDDPVTRAELASLVLRARHGARYTPPAATGSLFADVPRSHEAAAWIERFTATGIRLDCERGFCPDAAVRREELAMAIARTFAPGS